MDGTNRFLIVYKPPWGHTRRFLLSFFTVHAHAYTADIAYLEYILSSICLQTWSLNTCLVGKGHTHTQLQITGCIGKTAGACEDDGLHSI